MWFVDNVVFTEDELWWAQCTRNVSATDYSLNDFPVTVLQE